MAVSPSIPGALRAVAYCQLAMGLHGLFVMLSGLRQDKYLLAFDVLGIPIAFGLLRFSSAWRKACLALLVLGAAVVALVLVLSSSAFTSIIAVATIALMAWQCHVLTRPDIKQLFVPAAAAAGNERPQADARA